MKSKLIIVLIVSGILSIIAAIAQSVFLPSTKGNSYSYGGNIGSVYTPTAEENMVFFGLMILGAILIISGLIIGSRQNK